MERVRRVAWVIGVWVVLAALDLFFAGSVDKVEIGGAVFCASCGAGVALAMALVGERHYAWTVPPKAILRPLLALIPEFFVVARQLVAAILEGPSRQRGDFVHQPFEPGAADPHAATRRAAAIIGVSLAPRTFVIRGEQSDDLLLHGLPAKPVSADVRWPA